VKQRGIEGVMSATGLLACEIRRRGSSPAAIGAVRASLTKRAPRARTKDAGVFTKSGFAQDP
jgi:hypothetical protein